jgi:hypothetical protein
MKHGIATFLATGVLVSALPAVAQTTPPVPLPGTPYVKFAESLADLGGYQPIPNPNFEFSIPSGGALFGQCADISMPFDFVFYGDRTRTVSACAHGVVGMDSGDRFTLTNWAPGGSDRFADDFDGFIAPFWGRVFLAGFTSSSFGWTVGGAFPQRYLALEYTNLTDAQSSFQTPVWELDVQLRLYEGPSGRIEIDFDLENVASGSGTNPSATSGMESQQGDQTIAFIEPDQNPNHVWQDVARELDGRRLTFVQDPGVELVALAVESPEFAALGTPYEVEIIAANLNVNTLGPFEVVVEVSESSTFDPAAGPITRVGSNTYTLPPYQTRTLSVRPIAPVELGERRHYHRICLDARDVVGEVNETNNCVISEDPTRFLPSRPDVTVDRVGPAVRRAEPEAVVPVALTMSNVGSELAEDVEVAIMLSSNPAISPQDAELGRTEVSLAAGESQTVDVDVPLPAVLRSGAYYIGAFADIEDRVRESNEANNGRAANFELAVAGGELAIVTDRLPNPLLGETYSAQFTAVGGDGDYQWSIQGRPDDTLPNPGLSLEPGDGLVFGVCQTAGAQTFTVVVDSAGEQATKAFTLDCVDPDEPLTIVTRSVPDGIIGQEYAFPLIVTGGASAEPGSLTWTALNLPAGLDLTGSGVLAGTPVLPGTQVATVTVSDGAESDEQPISLTVRDNQNLLIQVVTLPTAELGRPYAAQIEATGGVGQVIFSRDGGTLPRGLVLNPDGSISGVPDQVGSFEFVVKAQDSPPNGLRAQDRNTFVVDVIDPSREFRVATEQLPFAVVGEAYNASISAVGGVPPLLWEIEGALPAGLEGQQIEGSEELIIRGTPETTEPGRFIVASVTDAIDREASKVLVVSVVEPGEDLPPCPDPSDERCRIEPASGGCRAAPGRTSGLGLTLALVGGALAVRRRRRRSRR